MKNVTAILSLLHEPAGVRCSAIRQFRQKPVLAWTLGRLVQCRELAGIAVLCWDDQKPAVAEATGTTAVIRSRSRTVVPELESVAAAQRWADGWRGGLLATCNFDLGFYGPWHHELASELRSDAIVLIEPAAALVDPELIDRLVSHAKSDDTLEYAFAPAAPGLMGFLIRPTLLNRLAAAKAHPGRLMHYHPDQTSREPIAAPNCLNIPAPLARTLHRFTLDSDRQISRINAATESLNGQLIHSGAEELVRRSQSTPHFGMLPREIVLELNTNRATRPIYWAGLAVGTQRENLTLEKTKSLFSELASAEGTRVTLAGIGDPLLHPHAFEIIKAAHEEGRATINVETDLLDLSDQQLEQLAACEADVISVNVPALSPRTYAAVMGRDALAMALDNVRRLLALRNQRGSVPIVTAIFTKCRQNLAEMEPWYDQWIRALGAAVVRGPSDFVGKIPDVSVGDMAPSGRRPCARLAARVTILSDGTIVACEQDVCGSKPLGHIGRDRLADVWKGGMQSLRDDHLAGNLTNQPLCAGCREWHRP